ncbi:MAG: hypothetical protein KJ674_02685 [Nanoarchaeota archaeon]|nr:hypothetical protein [Nanoarchaeota archaeon]
MVSVTLSVDDQFKEELKQFVWVNWSEIAREETKKKLIFEKYIRTKEISNEDWKFCEEIDWHPVDELPLKEEFVKELKKREKGPFIKFNSVDELFKK